MHDIENNKDENVQRYEVREGKEIERERDRYRERDREKKDI
jgi:hypothetical protein